MEKLSNKMNDYAELAQEIRQVIIVAADEKTDELLYEAALTPKEFNVLELLHEMLDYTEEHYQNLAAHIFDPYGEERLTAQTLELANIMRLLNIKVYIDGVNADWLLRYNDDEPFLTPPF